MPRISRTVLLCVVLLTTSHVGLAASPGDEFNLAKLFEDLPWVWQAEGDPTISAAPGTCYFRGRVSLPPNRIVRRVRFRGTADDEMIVYVNGHEAGRSYDWREVHRIGLRKYMRPGDNVVAIAAANIGSTASPAGLIGAVVVEFDTGEPLIVPVDRSWKVSSREIAGWEQADYDDGVWEPATEIAIYGDEPWGWIISETGPVHIPDTFPRIIVPGLEAELESLRALFHKHYVVARPAATMWDAWMVPPTIWPALEKGGRIGRFAERWARALTARGMDPDGYVHTHQHMSYALDQGWPFPFWPQGGTDAEGRSMAAGWHFHGPRLDGMYTQILRHLEGTKNVGPTTIQGWELSDIESKDIDDEGWHLRATGPTPMLVTPLGMSFDAFNSPYVQLRWKRSPAPRAGAECYIEWLGAGDDEFSAERRISFSPTSGGNADGWQHSQVEMRTHPLWSGRIERLRLSLAPGEQDVEFVLDSLFTVYDTRHPINNTSFVIGACDYFRWTGDVKFLKTTMDRLRRALRYSQTELGGRKHNLIKVPWTGHDGRSGITLGADGSKTLNAGVGIGNNYWDLLPFGNEDMYATMQYYVATLALAEVERVIAAHPEWNVPATQPAFDPDELVRHAAAVKKTANSRFWSKRTGRFVACVDTDGVAHDYGLTFLNLEAIHNGIVSAEHARSIMDWVTGKRIVAGDTSTGDDIYHWRFAPRATTLRNVEWYMWGWSLPESIPWGGQVQDGGAVLGFAYHDLVARLRVLGPDDAWQRLKAMIAWFDEVQAGGGYREYYGQPGRGTLQGGGTAGGLGIDAEFIETVLVPQIMIEGFLGFRPRADGFELRPRLPKDWPELCVTRILYRGCVLDVSVSEARITITTEKGQAGPLSAYFPEGQWQVATLDAGGQVIADETTTTDAALSLHLVEGQTLRLTRPCGTGILPVESQAGSLCHKFRDRL